MADDKLVLGSTIGETADTIAGAAPAAPSGLGEVTRTHYDIGSELARGGMGRILIARDRRIGRTVALKELLGSGDAQARRFEREALVTGRLQHPAIVPVYEAGIWPSGEPFYAMKLVTGSSLDRVVADKHGFAERLALLPNVIAICEAIAYAHGERVIHRDLKPQNVLVGKFGETVVVDWGLAKHLDEVELPAGPFREASGDLTAAGAVMGTPMYMPPEQADGTTVDERADVYALGAILYHVLTGGPPYRGVSVDSILDQVLAGPPPALTDDVPGDLRAIVGKAMSRDRTARYPSAKELADELVRFQAGQLVAAHAYSVWDLARRFVRRHRAAVIATGALVVLGGITAAIAIRQVVAARDAASAAVASLRSERSASLQEEGRRELYAGQPARASAYLAEAFRAADNPALRLELAEAMRSVDALIADLDTGGPVEAIVVARDSDRFATVTGSKVELWSIAGKRIAELPGALRPIVFAGARVVTATAGPLVVWDASDGRKLTVLADSDYATDLDAVGDRVYAAVSTSVFAWSASTGARLASNVIASASGASVMLFASADGKRVLVQKADGLAVLDATTLAVAAHLESVTVAAFDADGDRVLVHNDDRYALADPADLAKPLASFTFEGDEPRELDAKGDRFLEVPASGPIRLYTADGVALAGYGEGERVALAMNGKRVAIVGGAGELRVYDDRATELVRVAPGRHGISQLAFDRTGDYLVAAGVDGVRIWRVPPPRSRRFAKPGRLDEHAIAGGAVATVDGSTVRVLDAATGAPIRELAGTEPLAGAAVAPDGRRIAAFSTARVVVWEGSEQRAAFATLAITAQFSPDGTRIVTAGEDDAYVWDAQTGRLLATLAGGDEIATTARFSPDGARVVTGADDRIARVYDATTGAKQLELVGHRAYLVDAMFDASGTRIITASGDGTARIWDAASGRELHALRGHLTAVRDLALSHDGAQLATVADREACLWNARTGALESVLHGDGLADVAFAPGDRIVATASPTRVTLWDRAGAPISDLPPPSLPQAGLLIGTVDFAAPRTPTHHDRRLAFSPDGTWLLGASDVLQRFELPGEDRAPAEIADRVAKASGWRVENGGLVPSRDAEPRDVAASARVTVLDFGDDIVEAPVGPPDVAPATDSAAARLAEAEEAFAAGHPREIAARLVSALAIVDAGAPNEVVLPRVRELALQLTSEYQRTWDLRYGLAVRRIYGAYLARPRDAHDGEVRAARTALDGLIARGPTTRASLSKELVRRAVTLRRPAIAKCYADALLHDPSVAGRVTTRIAIEDGVVRSVEAYADAKLDRVRACLVAELRELALPHAPGSASVMATYPFLFRR